MAQPLGLPALTPKFIRGKQAQVTLEMTLGLIVALIFLIGATSLFVWFNVSLVRRQESYNLTRLSAGQNSGYIGFYESPEPLNIKLFGK